MNRCKFAENLKKIRKLRNMTQQELALSIGFKDKTAISKIERGVTSANYEQIDALCKVLKVKATQLFGYEDLNNIQPIIEEEKISQFYEYIPYLEKANEPTLFAIRKLLDMPEIETEKK